MTPEEMLKFADMAHQSCLKAKTIENAVGYSLERTAWTVGAELAARLDKLIGLLERTRPQDAEIDAYLSSLEFKRIEKDERGII